jgi:hypothetical protein
LLKVIPNNGNNKMAFSKELDENGFPLIGPHVGRELQLMLAGEKPMAKFTIESGMDPKYCGVEFEPYVANGRFKKFTSAGKPPIIERVWYCQLGEEWRAKLDQIVEEKLKDGSIWEEFTSADLARIDGFLLGYSKTCIEHFVEKNCRP